MKRKHTQTLIWCVYQSNLHGCEKVPEENNLKEENFIFTQDFRGIAHGQIHSKTEATWQKGIMEQNPSLHSSQRKKEPDRKGADRVPTVMAPWSTPFSWALGPISITSQWCHQIMISPLNSPTEEVSGLIHWRNSVLMIQLPSKSSAHGHSSLGTKSQHKASEDIFL